MATYNPPNMEREVRAFIAGTTYKSDLLGGIKGDAAHGHTGYHISREDVYRPDYSVDEFAADRRGASDLASAFDITFKTRAELIEATKRMCREAVPGGRLRGIVRAFNGVTKADTPRNDAVRIEVAEYTSTAGKTGVYPASIDHEWHLHVEIHRQFANDAVRIRTVLDVIGGKGAKPAPKPKPAPKLATLAPVRYGVTHKDIPRLRWAINKVFKVRIPVTNATKFDQTVLTYVHKAQKLAKLPQSGLVDRKLWAWFGSRTGA